MSMVSDGERAARQEHGALTVEGRQFGRGNKTLFPDFRVPLAPEWVTGTPVTLRALLEHVVRAEVAAFRERQEARAVLRALTAAQIADGAAVGKIDSGGRPDAVQAVSADESVQAALQAFEDGLYFVFVNDEQKQSLSDAVTVGEETRLTFLRLVALAGG